jgi:hypothetical protein
VAAQVAISIFLMSAAAVFLNHLTRLRNFGLGFRSGHVLQVTLDPSRSGYKREQLPAPYQELLARMQSIPQVRSASIGGCTARMRVGRTIYLPKGMWSNDRALSSAAWN